MSMHIIQCRNIIEKKKKKKKSNAGSDSDFSVQIQLNGEVRTSLLYDRLGNDFQFNKGDLWELLFSSFGFSENCIKISEIERISIVDSGIESDDWNIETIVTLVDDSSNNYQVLTHDFDVNRWINGHNTDSEHRRFDLNFAGIVAPYLLVLTHNAYMHGTTASGIAVNFLYHKFYIISIPT